MKDYYLDKYSFKLLNDNVCYNDARVMGDRVAYNADFFGRLDGTYKARKWTYHLLWLEDRSAANLWRGRADGIKEEVGVFYLGT